MCISLLALVAAKVQPPDPQVGRRVYASSFAHYSCLNGLELARKNVDNTGTNYLHRKCTHLVEWKEAEHLCMQEALAGHGHWLGMGMGISMGIGWTWALAGHGNWHGHWLGMGMGIG